MILGNRNWTRMGFLLMGHRTAFNQDNIVCGAKKSAAEWNESEMRLCPINDFIKWRLIGKNALQ